MYFFFFFKQKTAYEIYQCDWSSDVCSSDLDNNGDDKAAVVPGDADFAAWAQAIRQGERRALADRKSVV